MQLPLAQAWPFVHSALGGLAIAAGAVPILVHLINRRRYVRVSWAAMSFLLAAHRRSQRRMKFEQWLLLFARVLVAILFGLAVARPFVPAGSAFPLASSRAHRVLLVDNSLSMNASTADGATRLDHAKTYAQRLLDSFPATDPVSVITLARPATAIVSPPAVDRRFVRDRLAGVKRTERATDILEGLRLSELAAAGSTLPSGQMAVYLLSDFPLGQWSPSPSEESGEFVAAIRRLSGRCLPPPRGIHLVPVGAVEAPNLGVVRLAPESLLVGVDLPVRIIAEVKNFGASTVRGAQLQVRREGQIVRRETLARLEPGVPTTTAVSLMFEEAGTHLVEARVAITGTDLLKEDDARFLSIEVRETIPVLLVDGRPGTTQLAGQAGFLAAALAPKAGEEERPFFRPKVITDADLPTESLGRVAVVALCNVARLSPQIWKGLADFVHRGGGLLIFAGDRINADNYNRHGFVEGAGVVPVAFVESPSSPPADAELGLQPESLAHPMVAEFAAEPESGLFSTRVMRYAPVELPPGRGDVVLRYTNGDPALIAAPFGQGRVVVCTTTANMDWANLPARGDFVSLMLNTAAYLTPDRGSLRNIHVGDRIREPLTAEQTSLPLRVSTAGEAATEPSLVPENEGLALEYGPVEHAGPVAVSIGSSVTMFTVNVDPAESELIGIEPTALQAAMGNTAQVITDMDALIEQPFQAGASELASAAMIVVLILLFLEMWMAMQFSGQREAR